MDAIGLRRFGDRRLEKEPVLPSPIGVDLIGHLSGLAF